MKKVLVLGGYGNFGKRIVENLSTLKNCQIIISGRNLEKANQLRLQLKHQSKAALDTLAVDIYHKNFKQKLVKLSPDIVIHTCGPFQGQDYAIPQACIDAGAHYIDLADGREFVCGVELLDQQAKMKQLLVVSGASSVPGLSSTVIDHYQSSFLEIESIDISIAPGNKAERGEATIRGILAYTGRPFKVFSNGSWTNAFGWMNVRRIDFAGIVGKRWLANVDVPDLALFPDRYKVKQKVRFQAGLELSVLHLTMLVMACLAKLRLVRNWSKVTPLVMRISRLFDCFGTDKGGMQIVIHGTDKNKKQKMVRWNLEADHGIGPYIPTISAIIMAKKLLGSDLSKNQISSFGAKPCLGMFTLEEFNQNIKHLPIKSRVSYSVIEVENKEVENEITENNKRNR